MLDRFLLPFAMSLMLALVNSQQPSTAGFISIDCGNANSKYLDPITKISYVSDDQFINAGSNFDISSEHINSTVPTRELNLRSFPDGLRNCYRLKNVSQNRASLVRATFMYGNYDGKNSPTKFDLHIGVDYWKTIIISDPSAIYAVEALSYATANLTSVCLINTGSGTSFISSLELRPLRNSLYGEYVNASQSVVLVTRRNFGASDTVRFPDDPYDRVWNPSNDPSWVTLSTDLKVDNADDLFEQPITVLQTAVTPATGRQLDFSLDAASPDDKLYHVLYFTQLRALTGNATRVFNITRNGETRFSWYTPPYLSNGYKYSTEPFEGYSRYQYVLDATSNSTLPPIINAFEAYPLMHLTQAATDSVDVDAMEEIKLQYQIKRNWMSDPCAPKSYTWDGLNCVYSPDHPRIISKNLSSGGLTGEISRSFAMLKDIKSLYLSHNKLNGPIPDSLGSLSALQVLDLSCNNLTGTIPDSLGYLSSLQVLNLSGNNFNAYVPDNLRKNSDVGLMTFRHDKIDCTIVPSPVPTSDNKKTKSPIILIPSVVGLPLLLVVVVVFIVRRSRKLQGRAFDNSVQPCGDKSQQRPDSTKQQVLFESRKFTYKELENITNNFSRVMGKGGFGMVYHGCLEMGKQVAIKMRSLSSQQGMKEFLAEAQNLTKIYHRNLVSLVGYCIDKNCLALVYEYMQRGSLHENLQGLRMLNFSTAGRAKALNWGQQLQIALDAAQGLEYMHKGCRPPIIHRDIKTSNIHLSEELEARIADFGLSKSFHTDDQTHVSMKMVVGTPGYIDPDYHMYHQTYQLTDKSDVYSFGIVLLELITGRPPIVPGLGNIHIMLWIAPSLSSGNIDEIVDENLQGKYDPTSAWKILELALTCTADKGSQRPTMFQVVMQLKSCLEQEIDSYKSENIYSKGFNVSQETASDIGGPFGPSAR
ncbi:unnamed protein product [Musa hybrid cultivar]